MSVSWQDRQCCCTVAGIHLRKKKTWSGRVVPGPPGPFRRDWHGSTLNSPGLRGPYILSLGTYSRIPFPVLLFGCRGVRLGSRSLVVFSRLQNLLDLQYDSGRRKDLNFLCRRNCSHSIYCQSTQSIHRIRHDVTVGCINDDIQD